jgi:hypothetical protein
MYNTDTLQIHYSYLTDTNGLAVTEPISGPGILKMGGKKSL